MLVMNSWNIKKTRWIHNMTTVLHTFCFRVKQTIYDGNSGYLHYSESTSTVITTNTIRAIFNVYVRVQFNEISLALQTHILC